MKRAGNALISALVLLLGRGQPHREKRIVPAQPPHPRAELAVLALFGLSSTAAMGFVGYQDGDAVVHFTRTRRRDHYFIEVAPARSPQALKWIQTAKGISVGHGPPPRRMGWS